MSLTWKDAVGTILVAAVAIYSYAKAKGLDWATFGGWRGGTAILLLLGLGSCILISSSAVPDKNIWTTVATVFGVLGFVPVLAGLVFGSKALFMILAADIIVLWVVTTVHHVIEKGA